MQINRQRNDTQVLITLTGRLDTLTTPEFSEALIGALSGVTECVLELSGLEYISSAGLRVLLTLHKQMLSLNGRLVLRNLQPGVLDILEMTGFTGILTIENAS